MAGHYLEPLIDKQALIRERGGCCEICGSKITFRNPADLNHCLVKKKKHHPEYNVEENYQVVDKKCHNSVAHSFKNKQAFWKAQCSRYGREHMQSWYDSLELKAPERFD